VFLVSRGPGATNGSIAIHVAEQDATPVLLFIGQVSREERSRGAFQEVDYAQFFGGMAKGIYEIHDGNKIGEIVTRSLRLASEGKPGPVIISLPEDVLSDEAGETVPAPFPLAVAHHGASDIAAIQAMIEQASKPSLLQAPSPGPKGNRPALTEALRIPVAVTWKNQDIFDNGSPLYAGHLGFGNPPKHRQVLANADLIIAVGTRLGDVASLNYTFPQAPEPKQKLIHIYPDGEPIGKIFRTDLGLIADPAAVLSDLAAHPRVVSSARESWSSCINDFVREFQRFTSPEPNDAVDFGKVVVSIAAQAPDNAVITTDAGNMSTWVHRHWIMTPKNTLLGAIAGAMGFGVPTLLLLQLLTARACDHFCW
jgi:acetolactate synthase-1/2/3 large subunit